MDASQRVTEVAELMKEFGLAEAKLEGDGFSVAFKKKRTAVAVSAPISGAVDAEVFADEPEETQPAAAPAPTGFPVSSPMTGIYYGSPSPSAPAFVKEGDSVNAGAVVALIEAMKVFNEITAPTSGTVLKVVAKSGDLVNPGEPLLIIG